MPRITAVDHDSSSGETRELLDQVHAKFGGVPNLLATFAASPAALKAYLALSEAIGSSTLPAGLREQIALTVAGVNGCAYCASAHTAIAKGLKVPAEEATSALRAESADPKAAAALAFSKAIVERRGFVTDAQFQTVRDAGFSEAEIAEIVATVSLNIYTNYFNHVAETEIDFPRVEVETPELAGA